MPDGHHTPVQAAGSWQEVRLDKRPGAERMDRYRHLESGSARTAAEREIGHTVANLVAAQRVRRIQSYGLWAERALGVPPETGKTLIVKGQGWIPAGDPETPSRF